MTDAENAQKPEAEAASGSSQIPGIDDSSMQDIVDKLRILNYEAEFCPLVKPPFKPLNRFYFSGPSTVDNPNAQFYYFTSLCAWLVRLCGHDFDSPGQFDDPNATASTILAKLRGMSLSVANLAPNRIKQGSGEGVMTVLLALADQALIRKGFQFSPLDYSRVERYDELADVVEGDDGGDGAEDVRDNVVIDSDDEDEVYVRAAGNRVGMEEEAMPNTTTIDAEEWNLEVERVAPFLQLRTDVTDDWRSRVESATILLKAVEKMYPEVKQMLQRADDEMEKSRLRIQKREQTLAQQFSDQVEEYRVKLRELNISKDAANLASQSVQQLTVELNQVSEILDQTKKDIEERESKISDTTPLMQVKEAVVKVRAEIKQMALRIGVLQHGVLHYVVKQTKAKREGPMMDEDELTAVALESYYD